METKRVTHFRQLQNWQKEVALAQTIYCLRQTFPSEERFDLVGQMRRAAVLVPSNIAEGQARQETREFLVLLSHAAGSLAELESQLNLDETFGIGREWGHRRHSRAGAWASEDDCRHAAEPSEAPHPPATNHSPPASAQ